MNVNYTGRIGTTDGSVTKVNVGQDAEELQKAFDVARQFEEFFVRMMVQSFRKAHASLSPTTTRFSFPRRTATGPGRTCVTSWKSRTGYSASRWTCISTVTFTITG